MAIYRLRDRIPQVPASAWVSDEATVIGSVTLGAGKPLLPRTIVDPPLELLSVRAMGTGFAELHYRVRRG